VSANAPSATVLDQKGGDVAVRVNEDALHLLVDKALGVR
jgi:hypothetical protein